MARKGANANHRGRAAKQPTRRSQRQAARTTKTEESVPDEPGQANPAPAPASPNHVREGSATGDAAAPVVVVGPADPLNPNVTPNPQSKRLLTPPDTAGSTAWAKEKYVCTPLLALYEGASPYLNPRFRGYIGPVSEGSGESQGNSPAYSPSQPAASPRPRRGRRDKPSKPDATKDHVRRWRERQNRLRAAGLSGAQACGTLPKDSLDSHRDVAIPIPYRSAVFDRPPPTLDPSAEPKAEVGSRGPLEPVERGAFSDPPATAAGNVDAWLVDKHKDIYVPLPPDPEATDYYAYRDDSLGVLRYRKGEPPVFNPIPDETYLPMYTRVLWQRLEKSIADAIKNNEGGGIPTRKSFMHPVIQPTESSDNSARENGARVRVEHYNREGVNLHVKPFPPPSRPVSPDAHRKPAYVADTHDDALRNFIEGASCTSSPSHRGIPIPPEYRDHGIPYDGSRRLNSPVPPSSPESSTSSDTGVSDDGSNASSENEETTALIDGGRRLTTQEEVQYYVSRLQSCNRRLDWPHVSLTRRRRLTARMGKILRILDNQLKDPVNDLVTYTELAPIIEKARRIRTRCHHYLIEFDARDAQGIRPYCKGGRTVYVGGERPRLQLEQQQQEDERQFSPQPMEWMSTGEPETSDPTQLVMPSVEKPKDEHSGKADSSELSFETGN